MCYRKHGVVNTCMYPASLAICLSWPDENSVNFPAVKVLSDEAIKLKEVFLRCVYGCSGVYLF